MESDDFFFGNDHFHSPKLRICTLPLARKRVAQQVAHPYNILLRTNVEKGSAICHAPRAASYALRHRVWFVTFGRPFYA